MEWHAYLGTRTLALEYLRRGTRRERKYVRSYVRLAVTSATVLTVAFVWTARAASCIIISISYQYCVMTSVASERVEESVASTIDYDR